MALFGTPNSYIGIDIGTSSLKIVELVNRHKRVELSTYAQTEYENPFVAEDAPQKAIKQTADLISSMFDKAGISSDQAIAALPASAVFSTVITMPHVPENEMENAVMFAAKDVVPANLDDMVLGYNRLGEQPHLDVQKKENTVAPPQISLTRKQKQGPGPVFITAAPKYVVDRYVQLVAALNMKLVALELETFPLARSLLEEQKKAAMIVDIGDKATTYHIIDAGTPRVSHAIEFGGADITRMLADTLSISEEEAQARKFKHGLVKNGQEQTMEQAVLKQIDQAQQLISVYESQSKRKISQTVLIGGGANLPGLADFWLEQVKHKTAIGNPWKGLSYPQELEQRLRYLGPTYGVSVGLARRGFEV